MFLPGVFRSTFDRLFGDCDTLCLSDLAQQQGNFSWNGDKMPLTVACTWSRTPLSKMWMIYNYNKHLLTHKKKW